MTAEHEEPWMTDVATRLTAEQRVVLDHVSWDTYERLLADRGDSSNPRLTYDEGVLELMSPGQSHERFDYLIGLLVPVAAEVWRSDVMALGHLTFKNLAWQRGFEPDGCFWVGAAAAHVRSLEDYDAAADPPPNIVVEVDITTSSIRKLALFARFGVGEVWRHDGRLARILVLDGDDYQESATSRAFPRLTADGMTELLDSGRRNGPVDWFPEIRRWAADA